jgi:signal transduction histidine kinase/ActR/RegA family two-component response regulator
MAPAAQLAFDRGRVITLLNLLEPIAAGDTEKRLPISDLHDELDAIAYGINVLIGELGWSIERVLEAQEARASELRAAVAVAERANASKNVFLRNVSHEIRTPIAAMLGFVDLLASADLAPDERADVVARLQANGQAVLALLGDLLDLARLDADKITLTREPVCVFDLVREVLASVEIETRGKGLDIRVTASSGALGSLETDRYRLRQILVNLVSNAVKFTDAGGIVIALNAVPTSTGEHWIVDVTDTGIGITRERHAHLFEPFEQAAPDITPVYGGTGLGLALSRRLAEQLCGTLVLLSSEPGQGSVFRLTLKALPAAAAPVRTIHTPARELDLKGVRILLAEDHPDMQRAVRRLLEQAGASVDSARDGREAVTRVLSDSFDVVLMDLRMPHVDGLQATRTLRDAGCDVPIVALTADPATLRRAEALEAGCDDCLSKPFMLSDLVAAIRAHAERQHASI